MIVQCCVCKKFKEGEGQYRMYLPICPFLRVSHGYCDDCIEMVLNDNRMEREELKRTLKSSEDPPLPKFPPP